MPKNTVTDPITDQEIAFAHLILSGTMTDRRAAEAVGLNPETAAYTKSKSRVRDYMIEHRAAVKERLVEQEAQGLRKLNIGRDQILTRLWELATLSHEATRGSIAGQMKALAMIAAIEGLIPDRRSSPPATQPAAPPVEPQIHISDLLREQQAASEEPNDPVAAAKTQTAAPQVPDLEPAPKAPNGSSFLNLDRNPASPLNPFIKSQAPNRVPEASGFAYDAVLDSVNPIRLSFSPNGITSGRRR
jgi:hypothetical protein